MPSALALNLTALAALVPFSLLVWRAVRRGTARRGGLFWILLAIALAGPVFMIAVDKAEAWRTGFSDALWLTVGACLLAFGVLSMLARGAWRLAPLLAPYLLLLAVLATIWHASPERPLPQAAPTGWLSVHIAASLLTYALITLAAVAGLAVIVQERSHKARRPTAIAQALPPIADSERLELRLLVIAELVLGAGLLTGMALSYLDRGVAFDADHKSILSLAAFALIGLVLFAHYRTGVRGKRAARLVLTVYLLVTLAYPGVKFVTDVLAA